MSLDTAREICQETFALAWARFDLDHPQPLMWLYGLAWNQVKKGYRYRQRTRVILEQLALEAQSSEVDPRLELVVEVIGRLDERHREVLVMTYWDGLRAAQIGVILGISEAAVWQRLSHARAMARILFEGST